MAISNTAQRTGECAHCEEEHPLETAVGQFCSDECKTRHQADKALSQVRSDHRICGTCGGILKEVVAPDDEWVNEHGSRLAAALNNGAEYRQDGSELVLDLTECDDVRRTAAEAVCGFQYRTEEAELVVKEREGPHEHARKLETGTGCCCGSTDPSSTDDLLREADPARVLANYVRTFARLEREGAVPWRVEKTSFFERYRETRDFELALGGALYRP